MSAELLRRASTIHLDDEGLSVEYREAMAALLFMAADHAGGQGPICEACMTQAVIVARAYLGESA